MEQPEKINVEFHIADNPDQNGELPSIIFGMAGPGFSQCVILNVSMDPLDAVKNADVIYKAYIEACGTAVTRWKEQNQ